MHRLYVFYDENCPLCRRCREWAAGQPAYVRLEFWPLHSSATGARFGDLAGYGPENDLIIFSDEGGVYRGVNAWIIILWALRDCRAWNFQMAQPRWRPLVRLFWDGVSSHRRERLPAGLDPKKLLERALPHRREIGCRDTTVCNRSNENQHL